MLGIVLDGPAAPLTDLLTDMGLLTLATAGDVVRLLPPLNARDDEFEEALDMIDECLAEWHGGAADDVEPAAEEVEEAPAETDEAGQVDEAGAESEQPAEKKPVAAAAAEEEPGDDD